MHWEILREKLLLNQSVESQSSTFLDFNKKSKYLSYEKKKFYLYSY